MAMGSGMHLCIKICVVQLSQEGNDLERFGTEFRIHFEDAFAGTAYKLP